MSETNRINGQTPTTFSRFKKAAKTALNAGAKASIIQGRAIYNLTSTTQNQRAGKAIIDYGKTQINSKETKDAWNSNPAATLGVLGFGACITGIAEGIDNAIDTGKNAKTIATNIPLFEAAKTFYNSYKKEQ